MTNSIIEEVREARAALAKEHGFDRGQILEWAKQKQAQLKTKKPNKARMAKASKPSDKIGQQAEAPSL